MDITGLFRNRDLIPVTLNSDHSHFFAWAQLIDNLIAHACAGSYIQPGTARNHLAGSCGFFRILSIVSPLYAVDGNDDAAILCNSEAVRLFCRIIRVGGYSVRLSNGQARIGYSRLGSLNLACIGKGRNRKARHAEHDEQHTKKSLEFTLHDQCPPFHQQWA